MRRDFSTLRLAAAIVTISAFISWPACLSRRDPQRALEHATQTFHRGDLKGAQEEAEAGYRDFRSVGSQWAWRFRVLDAYVVYWQGRGEDVLTQLASEPEPPSRGDLAVEMLRLEGLAYSSLHKFPEAVQEFEQAARLCAEADSAACADLARARGRLEMERGHFVQAQALYEQSLASARKRSDRFLEAVALLNLSWTAEEQTHFDEAVDWADAARQISVPEQFADIAQTALGNMGWAYYKLGDPEKAKEVFAEAKQAGGEAARCA